MNELTLFTYEGTLVAFDSSAQMWNLNAMHQAAGGNRNKSPYEWLRLPQAHELVTALEDEETTGNSRSLPNQTTGNSCSLVETREGRNGGTWAHWQIAAAYAHYLNPRFYLQWNRWAMERVTGQADAARIAALETRITELEGNRKPRKPPLTREAVLRTIIEQGPIGSIALAMALSPSSDGRTPELFRHLRMLLRHGHVRRAVGGEYMAIEGVESGPAEREPFTATAKPFGGH